MIWYMMWYDIWNDMIWYIWYMIYDMIWCDIYDVIWYIIYMIYDMIYDVIWYDMMLWYDIWCDMIYEMIWYDIFNCNCVATRWQQYSTVQYIYTHKQYTEQHKNLEQCGLCPVFVGFTLASALQLRKKARRNFI
jgi:hypothetical protein